MQFTILGAGALGSIIAAHLNKAGHEVTIIARGERALQLQQSGLRLQGLVDYHEECNVLTDASQLLNTEILILTPKTYHHKQALEQVKHIQADYVFSVANGVLKTEQIESTFGTELTLGCMADLSGELLQSGEVLFTRNINLQIGELSPRNTEKVVALAALINDAGVNSSASEHIRSIEWSKFVPWLGFLALSVITRLQSYKFLMDRDSAIIMYRITREMYQLARSLEIQLINQSPAPALLIAEASETEAVEIIQDLGRSMKEKAPDHRMSALQDLENGRQLELEETIGDALKKAEAARIEMPTLEMCYHLLSTINKDIIT